MKTLAIIPMRSGSKGFPGKNSMMIGEESLAEFVTNKVVSSNRFDYVLCSTDSQELGSLALRCGAKVPFLRPAELATDEAPTSSAVDHAIRFLRDNQGRQFSHVFVFQVTSPFVTLAMIDQAFQILESDEMVDSVICGTQVEHHFHAELQFGIRADGSVDPAVANIAPKRRQDLETRFVRRGNLYATRVKFFEETGSLVGGKIRALIIDSQLALDIDSQTDLDEANERLRNLRAANFQI